MIPDIPFVHEAHCPVIGGSPHKHSVPFNFLYVTMLMVLTPLKEMEMLKFAICCLTLYAFLFMTH